MSANEYIIGEIVLLEDAITDPRAADAPVDDVSESVTVYKPDRTSETPAVAHDGTGLYSAQFEATQAGWHEYIFRSTGAGAGAGRGSFYVSDVP